MTKASVNHVRKDTNIQEMDKLISDASFWLGRGVLMMMVVVVLGEESKGKSIAILL